MSIKNAIKLFFTQYLNFSGRSSRSEYWFAQLFILISSITLISFLIIFSIQNNFPILTVIFALIFIIPSISLSFRRLHDINKSGLWFFTPLIPTIIPGLAFDILTLFLDIVLIYWYCQPGISSENKYGPNPLTLLNLINDKYDSEEKNIWDENK